MDLAMQSAQMDVCRDAPTPATDAALMRARLYHFLELALAHPAPGGLEYFRGAASAAGFFDTLAAATESRGLSFQAAADGAARFFASLRRLGDPEAEAAHIALFSVNFPQLPCPPYGSLYTVEGDKRLEEMRAIKQFYESAGIEVAEGFTDLPDHVCVELEFLQALCFREHSAAREGDQRLAAAVRDAQARFLERFLLPFVGRMADIAERAMPDNPYASLLRAADGFTRQHAEDLGISLNQAR
jgi:TorA maturation chaperone TorD